MELPSLPADFASVVSYLNKVDSSRELLDQVEPYKQYETKLRQIFAQQPQHSAVTENHLVPVFAKEQLLIKARNLETEDDNVKEKYLLPLSDSKRREHGSPATVSNIKEFKTNFSLFSEQALVDLDWSNVVAAGSSVVTSLLPVPEPHNESKRALRAYYHEQLAPASDIDLFVYGLNEEQALEKIKQIESSVRDSVLSETTTIRTKNAITIVSEYPVRHVQIVLRLYKSVTEILTGFDVDCSCVAFDGQQVWASPRALAAYATQQNSVDLTRRSPSYENRLSKYSHRGFEVYWPLINRSRVDPTIFERSFKRVVGLARLLVLEKLPHPSDRDSYADKRRRERGRPDLPWNARYRHALPGNVKDAQPDDVPDWLEQEDASDYHTFTIPYGPKFNAKRIEKLLFKQDLLLNAEWNRPKDRNNDMHRHPAFFGSVEDVIQDCCGFCPEPTTDEDLKAHEEESKRYVSGELKFMRDDPGRQAIGSFNPLTAEDWTDMAYLGSSSKLCQAIVDNDIDTVNDWFGEDGADVNRRDHTGRTPLQLACMCSGPEIVQALIDHGARIVARIYNGMTALHMAAHRGNGEIVKLLLDKSEANREEEDRKEDARKEARRDAARAGKDVEMSQADDEVSESSDDIEMVDEDEVSDENDVDDRMTEGSFVKVKETRTEDENENEPDVYDIDVLAWDSPVSALHLAIMAGHNDVVRMLIEKYGADLMLPVKLAGNYGGAQAILNLVLPLELSSQKANDTIRTLLTLGASPAQADAREISNLHHLVNKAKAEILDVLVEVDGEATRKVVNHLVITGWQSNPVADTPLLTALRTRPSSIVRKVLELGAAFEITSEKFAKAYSQKFEHAEKDPDKIKQLLLEFVDQPIIVAAQRHQMIDIVDDFIDRGVDVNTISAAAHMQVLRDNYTYYNNKVYSLLDLVQARIKELKTYHEDKGKPPAKPDPLPEFYDPGSGAYQSWILRTNYATAKDIHRLHVKQYGEDAKNYNTHDISREEKKKSAIDQMLIKWEALEQKIVDRGAKTMKTLHPNHNENNNYNNNYQHKWGRSGYDKDKPFNNRVSFQIPDLTDQKRERYLKLFEAVYAGDEDTVKELCMTSKDPLQISVTDKANFSPFSLAVLREQYDLAKLVLDIAAAQYQPSEEEKKTYRYSIHRPDDDGYYSDSDPDSGDDADDQEDRVRIYQELVDEKYTIDDVRVLSENVKSRTSPAMLFAFPCELWRASSLEYTKAKNIYRPENPWHVMSPRYDDEFATAAWFNEMYGREEPRNRFSLFRYAIVGNDLKMLRFLLGLQKDLLYREDDENTLQKLQMHDGDFDLLLRLGRTEMISEVIRRTGTLLPLVNLVEKSGVQLDQKPQYYQGLSVHGQKREDWAQQDRGVQAKHSADFGSPLLAAALSGNVKSVEYFLSDTPLRCYEEFAKRFQNDKHIRLLALSEGGIERTLHSWMDTRAKLAIHMAIMADPSIASPARQFLIKRMSQTIDFQSKDGLTPLHLALLYTHYDAVKELIAAGADQTVRDHDRRNILHTIYTRRQVCRSVEELQEVIAMFDTKVITGLTLQRCMGDGAEAQTPLMSYIAKNPATTKDDLKILDVMLKLSKEKDLEVMDGAGDYPLHTLVRQSRPDFRIIKYIVNRRPDLLFKENATGTTPLEMAENDFLRKRMDFPPNIDVNKTDTYANIANVSPEAFNGEFDSETLSRNSHVYGMAHDLYNTLKEVAERHPARRSLVSVLDANETARRLAEQQQKANEVMKQREAKGLKSYRDRFTRHRMRLEQQNAKQDEVSSWSTKATNLRSKYTECQDADMVLTERV